MGAADNETSVPKSKFLQEIEGWIEYAFRQWKSLFVAFVLWAVLILGGVRARPDLAHSFICVVARCETPAPPVPSPSPPRPAARVLVFDAADPNQAYGKDANGNKEVNAIFLVRELRRRHIDARPALIGSDSESREPFSEVPPVLAIVHRSTFEASNPGRADERIFDLIKEFPKTRFLIYSRKDDTDGAFRDEIGKIRGAAGRVETIGYPRQPNPWVYFDNVSKLLNTAEGMIPK